MSNIAPVILVVLGLPKNQSIAPLIVRCSTITEAIGGNPKTFTTPNPPLAQVNGKISTLSSAETALKNHTGTRTSRDGARVDLVGDMHALLGYVQGLVNASPTQAAEIAQAASMSLRKKGKPQKSDLAVKQTASGTVRVVAKALKGAKANDWQYSTDGGKTWLDVSPTTKATTTITGLQPGLLVHYRHRPITKNGALDWSDPISAIVT
jgi:hypothetical protein